MGRRRVRAERLVGQDDPGAGAGADSGRTEPMALSASSKALKPVGLFRRNKDQLLLFTRELSTLLKAGLSLDRSLALLISVNSDPAFSQVLSALQEKIKGGDSFADALAAQQGIFPDIYISLGEGG